MFSVNVSSMHAREETPLRIRAGFDIAFNCFQEVPMLLMLSIHPSRQDDLLTDHTLQFSPNVRARDFHDVFGNICTRLVAPPGLIEIRSDFTIADSSQGAGLSLEKSGGATMGAIGFIRNSLSTPLQDE